MYMKKLISAAAAFLLLPSVYACADEALVFSLRQSTGTAANGDILIEAEVTENPGVQSWVMTLGYDSSKADFTGCADGVFPGVSVNDRPEAGEVEINFFGSRDISAKGTAFTAGFTLKNGADSCTFTLKPSDDEGNFFNYAGEDILCRVDRSSLSFKAEAKDSGKQPSATQPETSKETTVPTETVGQPDPDKKTAEVAESAADSESSGDTSSAATKNNDPAETALTPEEMPQPEPSVDAAGQNAQPEVSAPAEDTSASSPDADDPYDTEDSASPETGRNPSAAALLLTLSAAGIFTASRRK